MGCIRWQEGKKGGVNHGNYLQTENKQVFLDTVRKEREDLPGEHPVNRSALRKTSPEGPRGGGCGGKTPGD